MAISLRLATLLLLLAIVCSSSWSPATAEAALTLDSRLLRQQLQQVDAATDAPSSSTFSSASGSSDAVVNSTASANTEASAATAIETSHEGPSTMSFVGPAIAGVLAIVLIGAVVTFKNRVGK